MSSRPLGWVAACMLLIVGNPGAAPGVDVDPALIRWGPATRDGGAAKAPLELDDGTILGSFTNPVEGGTGVICMKSNDAGCTWQRLSVIARDENPRTDIGDGNFVQLANGTVLHTYRHNHHAGLAPAQRSFAVEVAISRDRGATWQHHSPVMRGGGTEHGLWAPALFVTRAGVVQCYYDDEITPARAGLPGHQWAMMKAWDSQASQWSGPAVVSRARDPKHLSRDGMCSVVEMPSGRLICALESCSTTEPISAVIRFVMSDDGGRSWSWSQAERFILYETRDPRYNAIAPWLTRLADGTLLCVFATDEDQAQPDDVSTGILNEHLKYVLSADGGRSWTNSFTLVAEHAVYLPGVIQLEHGPDKGTILCCYVNHKTGALLSKRGTPTFESDAGESAPDAPSGAGAGAFVQIVLGDPCGKDDGRKVLIRNSHDSRTIRARVAMQWTSRGEVKTRESNVVVRPGDDRAKELGCSVKRVAGGTRSFEWTIVSAEFR